MNVDSVSISLVVLPLAFVDVSVGVPELSTTVRFILAPLSFVLGVVRPDLDSWSVPLVIEEVSFVNSSVFKGKLLDELEALFGSIPLKLD